MSIGARFKKRERLVSKKDFETVLNAGNHVTNKPFKIYWCFNPTTDQKEGSVKFGVSVPKRRVAKANHRNKVKRRIREAYRINKQNIIYTKVKKNNCLFVLAVYTSSEIIPFKELEKQLLMAFHKMKI